MTVDWTVPISLGHIDLVYDDGGRLGAGYAGDAGDCVARALAIAAEIPYLESYHALANHAALNGHPRSARDGVPMPIVHAVYRHYGGAWTPTMFIGSGCRVHLRADELPGGRIVARVTRHLVAVVDGVLHDNHDHSRGGTRCVYGYWTFG